MDILVALKSMFSISNSEIAEVKPSRYEAEYGRPVPEGYREIQHVNGKYTLEHVDGTPLDSFEFEMIFATDRAA
jgi:hypothetical protein